MREDFIQGLRDLADWVEANPSVEPPYSMTAYTFLSSKEEAQQIVREAGDIEKHYSDNSLQLVKKFGDIVRYRAAINRETVCTKVVKGTVRKEVPVYPDPTYVEKEVEIVEWECDPLLRPTKE